MSKKTESRKAIHGTKGCYYGGKWVDVEDLSDVVHTCHEENSGVKANSCRSMSKNSEGRDDHVYDVIIIGSGCLGASVARELSRTNASVLVLEAADDVSQGATKGNSGIIHAGYDDKPGSVRAKYCWPGNQMFKKLDEELHFGYEKNGSLVVAMNEVDMEELENLYQKGLTNGVKGCKIITDKKELFEMEPHLNPKAIGALYAPEAGNVIPYEFTIALVENAIENGTELRLRREVVAIHKDDDNLFSLSANYWEPAAVAKELNPSAGEGVVSDKKELANKPDSNELLVSSSIVVVFTAAICSGWVALFQNTQEFHSSTDSDIIKRLYGVQTDPAVVELCTDAANVLNTFLFNPMFGRSIDSTEAFFYCGLAYCLLIGCFSLSSVVLQALKNQQEGSDSDTKDSDAPFDPTSQHSNTSVSVDEMMVGGTGSRSQMKGQTVRLENYKAKYVVNCAGSYSDKIANMIGDDSFKITPRLGDYLLMHKDLGHLAKHTLFPTPDKRLGKGVLVQTTLWGNLILGPTARDTYDEAHMGMSRLDVQEYIINKCKDLVPGIDVTQVIHGFSGCRAKSTRGDWIIEPSAKDDNFIHVAGIDSPGLAGSPAIAVDVVKMLVAREPKRSPMFKKNTKFNPNRTPIITPKDSMWKGLKPGPFGKYTNPKDNVVCKCEKVTESEIIEACHRGIPIDSTQAIRKRTRAGMGHCQGNVGNYDCEHRVASIIARETGQPYEQVGRRPWPGTSTLVQRWMTDEEKQGMKEDISNAAK